MRPWTTLAIAAAAGCSAPAPTYEYGVELRDLELTLVSADVGVHPDRSVLLDPNNPFRDGIQGDGELRFDALEEGPIPGFYAFATGLAIIPYGENQYYAASQLHLVHDQELVGPGDLALVRDLAIRGYQAVLDVFPDTAFTFDATGRFTYDLLAPSVQGILDLGGTPENGWTLVTGPDGVPVAVQTGGT